MSYPRKTISKIKRQRKEEAIYNRIKQSAPSIPNITCPYIDSAINELENIREMNEQLRDAYFFWRKECKKLSKELLLLNKHVEELEKET